MPLRGWALMMPHGAGSDEATEGVGFVDVADGAFFDYASEGVVFIVAARVFSRSHPGGFSGIGIIPGSDPTGLGSFQDSTGLPKCRDQPGWGRDGARMTVGFGPKHDFFSINIKW